MSKVYFFTDGNGTITRIENELHSGEVVIPEYYEGERIISIGANAFAGCEYITSVTIPNSVTSIGDMAFVWCSSLISIDIPNSVTSIGNWAFQFCPSLTSIYIPNSVTTIGDYAFEVCTALTTVYVDDPNNLSPAVSSYNWSNTGSSGVTLLSVDELYRVPALTIHKLTLDQYKAAKSEGNVADDEVYVVTDVDEAIASIPTPDVSGQINTHNTATDAHADIRQAVSNAQSTADSAQAAISNLKHVYVGASAPADTKIFWVDSGNSNILKFYNGSAWVATHAVWAE